MKMNFCRGFLVVAGLATGCVQPVDIGTLGGPLGQGMNRGSSSSGGNDGSCRDNSVCGAGQTCVNGKCQVVDTTGCEQDSHCPADHSCVNGECVKNIDPACRTDGDCAEFVCPNGGFAHATCVDGTCVNPSLEDCNSNRCNPECPADYTCVNGECVKNLDPVCRTDADCMEIVCPNGGFAHGKCVDSVCVNPSPEDCNTIQQCRVDGDCLEGQACVNGICRDTADNNCRSDADCMEIVCPNGGFAHGKCVDSVCVNPSPEDCSTIQQCRVDRDCLEGQACVNGVCKEMEGTRCDQDGACPANLVCGPDGFCHDLITPVCSSDADCMELVCPNGGFIHAKCVDNTCVNPSITDCPTTRCTTDQDCPTDLFCKDGLCEFSTLECRADGDCPTNMFCLEGVCRGNDVPRCSTNSDCPADFSCMNGLCIKNLDPVCTTDTDCAEGLVCLDGFCTVKDGTRCNQDGVCPANMVCGPDGFCHDTTVTQCRTDAECPELVCPNGGFAHATCVDGICIMPSIESCATTRCTADLECAEGQVCVEGYCQEKEGTRCDQDGACPANLVCGPDGFCHDVIIFECRTDSDCMEIVCPNGGYAHGICVENVCVNPSIEDCANTRCATDADCPVDYSCMNGECIKTFEPVCSSNAECPIGMVCVNGLCQGGTDPLCGNGVVEMGEQCDDGNMDDTDGCTTRCTLTAQSCRVDADCPVDFSCMNGECIKIFEPVCSSNAECPMGMVCVDGLCQGGAVDPLCGNGLVEMGEECDDGNMDDTDGCTTRCTLTAQLCRVDADCPVDFSCMNGECIKIIEPVCSSNADCPMDMVCVDGLCQGGSVDPICGNAVVEAGEECDDGNMDDTDGCTTRCTRTSQPCRADSDCLAGLACINGVCTP